MASEDLDQGKDPKCWKAKSIISGTGGRVNSINLNDTRSKSIFDLHPDIEDDVNGDKDADLPSLADTSDYDDGSSGCGSTHASVSSSPGETTFHTPSSCKSSSDHVVETCQIPDKCFDGKGNTYSSCTISKTASTSSASTTEDIIQPPQIRRTNNPQDAINASSEPQIMLKADETLDKSEKSSTCDSLFCIFEFFSWEGDGQTKTKRQSYDEGPGGENVTINNKELTQSHAQYQINTIRRCIEVDIFQLMGCTPDGICIRSADVASSPQRHFCEDCMIDIGGNDDGDLPSTFLTILQAQCPHDCDGDGSRKCRGSEDGNNCQPNNCSIENGSKFLNRGVYRREKARMRIKKLRESGLSRDFSLVSSFLEEERAEMGLLRRHPKQNHSRKIENNRRPALTCSKSLDWSIQEHQQKLGLSRLKNKASIKGTGSCEIFERSTSCILPISSCGDHFGGVGLGQGKNAIIACVPSVDSEDTEIELFYDSDPGNDRSSLLSLSAGEAPNSKSAKSMTSIGSAKCTENQIDNETSTLIRSFDVETFNMNDLGMVTQLIKELTNGSLSLIWHPAPLTKKSGKAFAKPTSKNIPPLRTKAWFEMGSCLRTTLVQPKFIWRVYDANIDTSRRKRMQTIKAPKSVELLNIVRVIAPGGIDRADYPFAKTNCTFKICTNTSEEHTFEAVSEEERNRIVYAIKLVIARLASKIIVGDKDVFDEFFMTRSYRDKSDRRWKKSSPSPTSTTASIATNDDSRREDDRSSGSMSRTTSICSTLVQPVTKESGRQEELWGSRT